MDRFDTPDPDKDKAVNVTVGGSTVQVQVAAYTEQYTWGPASERLISNTGNGKVKVTVDAGVQPQQSTRLLLALSETLAEKSKGKPYTIAAESTGGSPTLTVLFRLRGGSMGDLDKMRQAVFTDVADTLKAMSMGSENNSELSPEETGRWEKLKNGAQQADTVTGRIADVLKPYSALSSDQKDELTRKLTDLFKVLPKQQPVAATVAR